MKGEVGQLFINFGLQGNTSACGDSCTHAERPLCKTGAWEGPDFRIDPSGNSTCADVTCADVLPYCYDSTELGIRSRMVCPVTCGCSDPQSPLAIHLPISGCPSRCDRTSSFKKQMAELPCEDVNKTDPNWLLFLDNMEANSNTYQTDWRGGGLLLADLLRSYGCAFLTQTAPPSLTAAWLPPDFGLEANFCVRDGGFGFPFKPLSLLCPVSCGCRAGDNDCPDSCPARPAPRAGNSTTRRVDYSGLESNYVLPSSRGPGYVPPY